MPPIRTAIIGLSASAATSWASSAHLPYLLSPLGQSHYQIVALCNSSVEAAQRAITHYNLPPNTRAYGDPQSLADDPDIDLVVCCTRVDVHYPTILPSVKAGKSVFVEWPLAQDVEHARELVEAVESSGSRSVIGLQGRLAPIVVKVRGMLEDGVIGKVLSSQVRAAGGSNDRKIVSSGLKYFADRNVGGNIYTIGFGHLFDQVQHVLGDFHHPHAHLQLQRPDFILRDPETQAITGTTKSNVPDLITTSASLPSSPTTVNDASIFMSFRRGQPFPGDPALVWTINGEKGEIRLIAQAGTTLHATAYTGPVTLEVHDFETDEIKPVEWTWEGWQEELPMQARSIGAVYEEFAKGEGGKYPSFGDALKRHEQLTEMLSGWAESH